MFHTHALFVRRLTRMLTTKEPAKECLDSAHVLQRAIKNGHKTLVIQLEYTEKNVG